MIANIPIVVIGYNRPKAIERLLNSLLKASYPGAVQLIISIDGEAGKRGSGEEVKKIAADFDWPFGEKKLIIHESNLGLKNHVLSCGDLSRDYEGVIVLEDDLYVSPFFYQYTLQAYDFYKDDEKIAGISLYHHAYNETAQFPFIPLADGTDVYFLQYASSWGQMWTASQWDKFRRWFDGGYPADEKPGKSLPPNIKLWPENSWKKSFIEYLILHDLYFVYPGMSMTTIFGDEGTNIRIREAFLQVPLWYGDRPLRLIAWEESCAVYDTWCEMIPDRLKRLCPDLADMDFDVDLYGMKSCPYMKSVKVISGRSCKNPERTYGREMKPQEENMIHSIPGNYFHLGKKEDFFDTPYLTRLLKCHEKKELSYWYPIREYHFYKSRLLATGRNPYAPSNVGFVFRKFITTGRFVFRYFLRKA